MTKARFPGNVCDSLWNNGEKFSLHDAQHLDWQFASTYGVSVAWQNNGDEALQRRFGEVGSIPSLVLLDLQLPKIGGTTFLARVRERLSTRDLPIIVLSSSDNPLDIKLCQELGISGYLSKPLDLAALQELLATIIPL